MSWLARLHHRRSSVVERPLPPVPDRFGIRSVAQVRRDLGTVIRHGVGGGQFQLDRSSLGHVRPLLSLPAYAGFVPADGLSPIMNLFDRIAGGRHYSQRVSKRTCRDFRGGVLTYDEHDGVDFVCPVGTPLCAAAPGKVALIRDRWLRGGLTLTVDHGHGVTTQYTHCSRALAGVGDEVERGQPIALSGSAGLDMTAFFPWVPPHVHFMLWVDGQPMDPFLVEGEEERAGAWVERNTPRPSGPLGDDPSRALESGYEPGLVAEAVAACEDPELREELRGQEGASLVALLEDALHHDQGAWPEAWHRRPLRVPDPRAAGLRLSLPLPRAQYQGARFTD